MMRTGTGKRSAAQRIAIGAGILCLLLLNSPARAAQEAAVAQATDCADRYREIADLYRTIPTDFRDLKEPVEDIAKRVVDCRERLERFLEDCAAFEKIHHARYMLARLMLSLVARERERVYNLGLPPEKAQEAIRTFLDRIATLCREALARIESLEKEGKAAADDIQLRPQCIDLIADASFQNRDFEQALENYRTIFEKFSGYTDLGNAILGVGRSYLELRRTKEGIEFMEKVIREHYRDQSLPFFYEIYWNLLETDGDIDGMIQWVEDVKKIFPVRLLREGIGKVERDAYVRFLGFSGFRLGYSYFAKGDLGAAAEAFTHHIEALDKLEEEQRGQGRQLPPELDIYRQRSRDIRRQIQDRVGSLPGMDFDAVNWGTPHKVLLAEGRGKAAAIIFRGYEDPRSAGFINGLDKHFARNPAAKELVVINYMRGSSDPEGQLDKVRNECDQLELRSAAVGLDSDGVGKSLFRAFEAMVGTATFMIYDRQGRLAWFQQDPRDMDVKLAARIWDRISRGE